jgi:tetratricopeptide (TPR) repeat protein
VTIDPADTQAQIQRASALIELRRYDEAVVMLTEVIQATPDRSLPWCCLTQAQLGLKKNDDALQSALRAVSLTPGLEWPHRLASISFGRLERHQEAVAAAREAVRLDPHSWRALTRLALACVPSGLHLTEAEEAARRSIEIAPSAPDTHIALGSVQAAAGRRKDAEASFLTALELDPNNVVAHNELGRLHLRRESRFLGPGNLSKAARRFATALAADPRSQVFRRNLDVVVAKFLVRVAYLVMLAAFLIAEISHVGGSVAVRTLPLLLLLVPGLFTVRFLLALDPAVRRFVRGAVRSSPPRVAAVAGLMIAIVLLVIDVGVPETSRPSIAFIAGACAFASLLSLQPQIRQAPSQLGQPKFRRDEKT